MNTLRSISKLESYRVGGLNYGVLETPAGPVSVGADREYVVDVQLGRRRPANGTNPVLRRAMRQLREYFDARRRVFDVPLRLETTGFTSIVLEMVDEVPFGETVSYGGVASAIRKPGAARAVGGAVGRNPLPIFIPCHRVLAAHGRLGGFGGGLRWKRFLLRLEGVEWK